MSYHDIIYCNYDIIFAVYYIMMPSYDFICDVMSDIICPVQAQGTKTYAGRHKSRRYHHFTGRERLDVHLLKPSRLELVQEQLQDVQRDADIAYQAR